MAEPEVGLVLHDFVRVTAEGGPFDLSEDRYGEQELLGREMPDEVRVHGIRAFMRPSPRAWCGCMMAFRREWTNVLLPIYPGKGHDDWILKLLGPLTEVRFVGEPLIQYRIHNTNANNHEVGRQAWLVFFLKLRKRLHNMRKGYSKKNFYRSILKRIEWSGAPVKRPELLEEQFAAILRVSARGPVRVMLPMITSASEVKQARDLLAQTARRDSRSAYQSLIAYSVAA